MHEDDEPEGVVDDGIGSADSLVVALSGAVAAGLLGLLVARQGAYPSWMGLLVLFVVAMLVATAGYRLAGGLLGLFQRDRRRRMQPAWLLTWLSAAAPVLHWLLTDPSGRDGEYLLLPFLGAGLLGHLGLAMVRRRPRPAAGRKPTTKLDDDVAALLAAAQADVEELRRLCSLDLADDDTIEAARLLQDAEASLTELNRLAPRVARLRRVAAAHPADERAAARVQRAFDRLMKVSEALETAADAARDYATGQRSASGLAEQAGYLERLVESHDELDAELRAGG